MSFFTRARAQAHGPYMTTQGLAFLTALKKLIDLPLEENKPLFLHVIKRARGGKPRRDHYGDVLQRVAELNGIPPDSVRAVEHPGGLHIWLPEPSASCSPFRVKGVDYKFAPRRSFWVLYVLNAPGLEIKELNEVVRKAFNVCPITMRSLEREGYAYSYKFTFWDNFQVHKDLHWTHQHASINENGMYFSYQWENIGRGRTAYEALRHANRRREGAKVKAPLFKRLPRTPSEPLPSPTPPEKSPLPIVLCLPDPSPPVLGSKHNTTTATRPKKAKPRTQPRPSSKNPARQQASTRTGRRTQFIPVTKYFETKDLAYPKPPSPAKATKQRLSSIRRGNKAPTPSQSRFDDQTTESATSTRQRSLSDTSRDALPIPIGLSPAPRARDKILPESSGKGLT